MLTIRLLPIGRKHKKLYRLVLAEKHRAVGKKYLENLGFYDPHTKETKLNSERLTQLLSLNTDISESAQSLLRRNNITAEVKQPVAKKEKKVATKKDDDKEEKAEKKTPSKTPKKVVKKAKSE